MRSGGIALLLLLVAEATAQQTTDAGLIIRDTVLTEMEVAAETISEPEVPRIDDSRQTVIWSTSGRRSFESKAGYRASDSTAFYGPPISIRSRLQIRLGGKINVYALMDHDAGEATGSITRLFDLASATIKLAHLGPLRTLTVGGIRPRIGLGLSVWAGMRGRRLDAGTISLVRIRESVTEDASAVESPRMTGVGIDLMPTAHFRVLAFGGWTRADAVLSDSGFVTSISTSGLHRNHREAAQNDRLKGRAGGVSLRFVSGNSTLGGAAVLRVSELSIERGTRAYEIHSFYGRRFRALSLFGSTRWKGRIRLAGELSVDDDGTPGALIVGALHAEVGIDLFFCWRDYPPSFNSVLGAPPSATGSTGGNERGWVVGIVGGSRSIRYRVYRNLYRKPWLQFDSYRPSSLTAWGFEIERRSEKLNFVIRYDARNMNRRAEVGSTAAAPFHSRSRLRLHLSSDRLEIVKPTLDFVHVQSENQEVETGDGIGQRLEWMLSKTFRMVSGVVFFQTDSGNSGIHLYEPDLPDYFSVPLLTGSGYRVYGLLEMRMSAHHRIWIKFGFTRYERERTFGSGPDRVTTERQRSIAAAARIIL